MEQVITIQTPSEGAYPCQEDRAKQFLWVRLFVCVFFILYKIISETVADSSSITRNPCNPCNLYVRLISVPAEEQHSL